MIGIRIYRRSFRLRYLDRLSPLITKRAFLGRNLINRSVAGWRSLAWTSEIRPLRTSEMVLSSMFPEALFCSEWTTLAKNAGELSPVMLELMFSNQAWRSPNSSSVAWISTHSDIHRPSGPGMRGASTTSLAWRHESRSVKGHSNIGSPSLTSWRVGETQAVVAPAI